MKATEVNYAAVRAFVRVWAPIAEAYDIGASMDAGFDGGEWSVPANARREAEYVEYDCMVRNA